MLSRIFALIALGFAGIVAAIIPGSHTPPSISQSVEYSDTNNQRGSLNPYASDVSTSGSDIHEPQGTNVPSVDSVSVSTSQKVLSDADLLALASNTYADGNVPLGDYKYSTTAPKKGYIYLCRTMQDSGGAQTNGSWIHGNTWNFLEKINVQGSVSWPNASFKNTLSSTVRTVTTNALPLFHTTGTFPVQSSDPAYQIDKNPNTIKSQNITYQLPADPIYSDTPNCMGGEVGVMLSGVPLFNGFDAGMRDAAAHELQDSCDGHPQGSGEYHYHSLSACFKDISEKTVLGYALDGFPITGPLVATGKYLTTDDLDVCHGVTSAINIDGKSVTTYHYVMTQDFPYSVSCFRGKPSNTGPTGGVPNNTSTNQSSPQMTPPAGGGGGVPQGSPPQEALSACSGKNTGSYCSFTSPRGDMVSGYCQTPPGSSLACVPQ